MPPRSKRRTGNPSPGHGGAGRQIRWRLILTILSLAGLGGGAIYAATIVESDVALGGLVTTAGTCATGLAAGLAKLIEKD